MALQNLTQVLFLVKYAISLGFIQIIVWYQVFPSPGTGQTVWGQDSAGQSCGMVSATVVSDHKDSNILSCSESTDFNNVGHNSKSVFDLVRNG